MSDYTEGTIKADQSHLPRKDAKMRAEPPHQRRELFAPVYSEWLLENNEHRDMAVPGRRFRASWSGGCWRQLAYKIEGVDETEITQPSGYHRMRTGTHIHDRVQQALLDSFDPNVVRIKAEEPFDLLAVGIDGCGHGDVLVDDETQMLVITGHDEVDTIVVEIKSINGTGFRNIDTEGPRFDHVTQGALAATAEDADLLVIWYLAVENIGLGAAARRGITKDNELFQAEFILDRSEYQPYFEAQKHMTNQVLEMLDGGRSPDEVPTLLHDKDGGEFLPKGAYISNPNKGTWVLNKEGKVTKTGRTWNCDYCNYRTRCLKDGAQ